MAAAVVHYNTPEFTRRLLSSLNKMPEITTTILVDHSETELLKDAPAVVLREPNRGYASGINFATRYLLENHPEIRTILAMNPDIELNEDSVAKLLETHEREKAALTFPAIRESNLLLQGYSVSGYGTIRRVKKDAHLFPGTCFLFSVEAWEKAGGFNETYFHYFEDFDFCETVYRQNGKICHNPDVVVKHLGKSGAHYPATSLPKYAIRNHLLFFRKFGKPGLLAFWNICLRQLFYLLRWPSGWRGIPQWYAGIREFRKMNGNE